MKTIIKNALIFAVPTDGTPIGNVALRRQVTETLAKEGIELRENDYVHVLTDLVTSGVLVKGQGSGRSLRRAQGDTDHLVLEPTATGSGKPAVQTKSPAKPKAKGSSPSSRQSTDESLQIISYRHPDKRVNNPEVGMVTTSTDPEQGKTRWQFDPHLDPVLQFDPQRNAIESLIDSALASGDSKQMCEALEELKRLQSPYLNWAGKAERTSFDVDTVSLHVHERVDPASILSAVRKAMKNERKSTDAAKAIQPGLFDAPFESLPLRDAIDFYRHERGWANRVIAGDSLLVMNSLLQKESMAGRVQMIYIDPPYGIKYGSNFQPFVGKRDVKDRSDADLTQEPEMIKAFRDTWELGIHSYLTYLRDRLLLSRELLNESGSVFVQISDENLHHVREILDEVFGAENFCSMIFFKKTGYATADLLPTTTDITVWYAKNIKAVKYYQLFERKEVGVGIGERYNQIELSNGSSRNITKAEMEDSSLLPKEGKVWMPSPLTSSGFRQFTSVPYTFRDKVYDTGLSQNWKTTLNGLERLTRSNRIDPSKSTLNFKRYIEDFPAVAITNIWDDTMGAADGTKLYVVQTATRVLERCLLMTTDAGDLVLDPTCGSGTTAFVAEKWGRRWITCDTSRVAITLTKQRLLTASYDYYELKYPHEGLKGGFIYKTIPHVTLKSIANNPDIDSIYERMHPVVRKNLDKLNNEVSKNLKEWEIPFDFPADWPEQARKAFDSFHQARQAMQNQMDASIAAHADQEVLYDQPTIARNKLRITGPFTVEAVPFPNVKSLDEASGPEEADASIARTGESGRQHQWREELLKTGIRGKGGQMLKFAELEALPFDSEIRSLHAIGHLQTGERVVVSFGPEHGALEQRQVQNGMNEAGNLFPLPKMIVFCAFTFDPEAAKDIDAIKGITALKAQMNTDLLTEDLKKARSSNQSFWLMGQPEIEVRKLQDGRFEVEVHGFDYFDMVKGELVSGGKSKIAMWVLDPDYDERSLFPRQVFFPQAGKGEGWERLRKSIRAELDESRLEKFSGTISLPFEAGDNRKIAVKIIDDRGIESLKVIALQ